MSGAFEPDGYRDARGECLTCWSVAECTNGRVRRCRWCRDTPRAQAIAARVRLCRRCRAADHTAVRCPLRARHAVPCATCGWIGRHAKTCATAIAAAAQSMRTLVATRSAT